MPALSFAGASLVGRFPVSTFGLTKSSLQSSTLDESNGDFGGNFSEGGRTFDEDTSATFVLNETRSDGSSASESTYDTGGVRFSGSLGNYSLTEPASTTHTTTTDPRAALPDALPLARVNIPAPIQGVPLGRASAPITDMPMSLGQNQAPDLSAPRTLPAMQAETRGLTDLLYRGEQAGASDLMYRGQGGQVQLLAAGPNEAGQAGPAGQAAGEADPKDVPIPAEGLTLKGALHLAGAWGRLTSEQRAAFLKSMNGLSKEEKGKRIQEIIQSANDKSVTLDDALRRPFDEERAETTTGNGNAQGAADAAAASKPKMASPEQLQEWEREARKEAAASAAEAGKAKADYQAMLKRREETRKRFLNEWNEKYEALRKDNQPKWYHIFGGGGPTPAMDQLRRKINAALPRFNDAQFAYYDFAVTEQGEIVPLNEYGKEEMKRWRAIEKVSNMSAGEKLGKVLQLAAAKFPGDFGKALLQLAEPQNLAILVGGIALGAVASPGVMAVIGMVSIALAGKDAIEITRELYLGIAGALNAKTPEDQDRAATRISQGLANLAKTGVTLAAGKAAAKLAGVGIAFIRKRIKAGVNEQEASLLMERIEAMKLSPEEKKKLIAEVEAALREAKGRYSEVGGHHVHSKAGFKGNFSYDPNKGFSISQEYMKSRNWNHQLMTNKQRELFKELAQSGRPNTLAEHSRIAEEALVAGGATRAAAKALVKESLKNLAGQDVTDPSRIPYTK